uniref:Uncharacterized protein n=2 Tax=Emiliania huxleyi TaxID=2903 RepID=A0A0D3KVI9_EMIH1
ADRRAGPATLDGPAAGTRRPPRALVVCEATARRRCVRRRSRLAVRWDGGMARRRAARARLGAVQQL